VIFAVLNVSLAVNLCINCSFFIHLFILIFAVFTRLSLPYRIKDSAIALFKTSSGSMHAVVHQILSKSKNILLGYDNLTIFKMAAVRHLGF